MAKLTGATATAGSSYGELGGTPASAIDGNTGTAWVSANTFGNTVSDGLYLEFPQPVNVKRIRVMFYSWSRNIKIGYANAPSTAHSAYTIVKNIDAPAGSSDEMGKAWAPQNVNASMATNANTILLSDNNVSAKVWAIFPDDATAGALSITGGTVDRLRILEIELYDDAAAPVTTNPKPPTTVPVLPFSATPANWTRTEFATAGTYNFTPAQDTTMLLVVGQGAGAAGRIHATLAGEATLNDNTLDGGDTFVSVAAGRILNAPGALGTAGGAIPSFPAALGTAINWARNVDSLSRAGATSLTSAGPAGAQSYLTGAVGAAFTLAGQSTNLPADTASNAFTGPNPTTKLTWTFANGGVRQNTTGLSMSAPGASVEIPFKGIEGQTFTLNIGATSGNKFYTITLNGVDIEVGSLGTSAVAKTFPITTTGDQVLSVVMRTGTSGTFGIGSLVFNSFGFSPSRSGGSGRTAQLYMLPENLTINVGKGGVGQAGGQAVTSAQNGQRGSGGGVGGNGGDGVVVIYEFKQTPQYEISPQTTLALYNVSPTLEVTGAFRTNYVGLNSAAAYNTQTAFSHKLRPRTKTVFALMTGAGGKTRYRGAGDAPSEQILPTVLTSGSNVMVAESGWSGNIYGNTGGGNGGAGGNFQESPFALFSGKGSNGTGIDQNSNNTSTIAGNYGSGASSGYLNNSGGGCGGWGLVVLTGSTLPASRTLDLLIANTDGSAIGGAIYVYETESEYGPFITQLAEQIMLREARSRTQVTQSPELVLGKQQIANTQVTQSPELILTKENDAANNLQVSHATIAFIVDADDPVTAITQTTELVLGKQKIANSQVTQTPELILAKQPYSVYRTSQVAEMLFLSEIPSIFWLNFGTIDNPVKNQMYTSLVGRATSVKSGAYIQLESAHAEGTKMFINDVDVGLSGSVKNNDRVYIYGGIPNWWQTSINVYTYYITNGEVTRELVGTWLFKHPIRTPTISRAYAELALQTNWLKLAANIVRGASFTVLFAKANIAVASLTSMFTQALASSFANVGVLYAQANAQYATAALGWELAKANASDFDGQGIDFAGAHSELSDMQTYEINHTHESTESFNYKVEKIDAISTLTTLDDFGIVPVSLHEEAMFDFAEYQVGSKEYTNTEFNPIQAAYGDKVTLLTSDYTVGYGSVKTKVEKWDIDKQGQADTEFLPIMYTHYFGVFHVDVIPTIAYSVLVGVEYEFQKIYGTSSYFMPKGNADVQKTGFGHFETGTVWTISYSTPSDRGVEKLGSAERGYFDTTAIFTSAAYGQSGYGWVRDAKGMQTFELNSVFVQKGMRKVNLIPYRYEQTENGRGKASLYLGFDTKADAQTFTQNYSDVTITPRFNGFTYTVGVDKTFVCEIYFNGPVSGLIQGG